MTTLMNDATCPVFFACLTLGGERYVKAGMNTVYYELYADTSTEMKGHTYETLFAMWEKDLRKIAADGQPVIIYIHNTIHNSKELGYYPQNDDWKALVTRIVSTFKDLPNLSGWAFSDEVGDHVGYPNELFQQFLREKYETVSALNAAWGTGYSDLTEVTLPYKDKDGEKGTGIPLPEMLDDRYPLGLSRKAFDAADFKLYRVRHAHEVFEETVRKVDAKTPLWSGAHNLAWAATQVPEGWGAWHDAYPTYSGDDWLTHHAWFQAILRGQNFRPVLPMLMVETSNSDLAAKWNLDPRTWGGWMVQAALQGSSGITFWPWHLLAEDKSPNERASANERSDFVTETISKLRKSGIFDLKPDNSVAVLYQPYAEGWHGVSQVYGLLPTPPGTPLELMNQLAFGTPFGSVDYLTNQTLLVADLSKYGVVIAPFAPDIPPAVQNKLDDFVAQGGVLLADAGFSAKSAAGNLTSLTPAAAKLLGIQKLSSSRIEGKWTVAKDLPPALQNIGLQPEFETPLKALLRVEPTTARPVFVGPDGQGLFVNNVGKGSAYFYSGILHDERTLRNDNVRRLHLGLFSNRARIKKGTGERPSLPDNNFFTKDYQLFNYDDGFAVANLKGEDIEAEFEAGGKLRKETLKPYECRLYRGSEVFSLPTAFFPATAIQNKY